MKMFFESEKYVTMTEVQHKIKECEGRCIQQVCYSSFHDCLTQVCFGCKKVRSNIKYYAGI